MDARAQQAREHHRTVASHLDQAGWHRVLRDQLVCQLRREDPDEWSYRRLALAVGCSPELIAAIIRRGSAQ